MSDNCPTCGQAMPGEKPKTERVYVKVNWEAFRDLCSLLLKSPNCKDEKFRASLEDLPQSLARYNQLTAGQWKYFSVIHKNVFGNWPPNPEDLVLQRGKPASDVDLDQIPF